MTDFKTLYSDTSNVFSKFIAYQDMLNFDVNNFLDVFGEGIEKKIEDGTMTLRDKIYLGEYFKLVKDLEKLGLIDLPEKWKQFDMKY